MLEDQTEQADFFKERVQQLIFAEWLITLKTPTPLKPCTSVRRQLISDKPLLSTSFTGKNFTLHCEQAWE